MLDLFFPWALLPTGWAADVRISVAEDGTVAEVTPDGDLTGCRSLPGIAVPGVPNLHSHAFQRGLAGLTERGSADGDTFWSWRRRMYGFLERLTPEHAEAVAARLFVELLRHGYTSVAEFHYVRNDAEGAAYHPSTAMADAVLSAARRTGMGVTLLPVLYRSSDFGGRPPLPGQRRFVATVEALLDDIASLRAATEDEAQIRVGLALHSLRAVPPEAMAAALEGLAEIDPTAPVHIHVAEQRREVEACLEWAGARPVAWLLDHAPVDERWCLVHATHMDDAETRRMAASGAVVGLCPTTEANLGDGVFPFAEYLVAGGAWGVGTDSHVSVSPVADLRLLEYGQRLTRERRNVAAGSRDASTGRVLLDGAWAGGARACARNTGQIEPGARADLVILNPDHPALVGRRGDAVLDAWIFSGEDTPVRHVLVGGRWVVEDGRHPLEEETAEAYGRIARALSAPG